MAPPIFFLLDRSGSMDLIRDDTIGGFNSFVNDQRALNPNALITLWQFDHEVLVSYENKPLREIPPLNLETFQPRGSTHLLDTMGDALKVNPVADPPIFVIFTDGQENGSSKYTKAQVKDLVEKRIEEGWTFLYLGANQDAFAEAGSIGIRPGQTLNYDTSHTPEVFRALSTAISSPTGTVDFSTL